VTQPPHVPTGIRDVRSFSPELESLRGWAILLVFGFHASGFLDPEPGAVGPLLGFLYAGHTGVTLFFVLSAFLLTRPFWAEARGGPPTRASRFYARRALRILPLYVAVVAFATWRHAEQPADWWKALPHFTFLMDFFEAAPRLEPYSNVWWSLATEVQFYLVLPWLARLLRRPAGRRLCLGLVLLYGALYAVFAAGVLQRAASNAHLAASFSLAGRAPTFALGALAAGLVQRHGESLRGRLARSHWLSRGGADAVLVALLAGQGCLLAAAARMGFFQAESYWPEWHLCEAALWSALLLLLLLAPLRSRRLLCNRALSGLGVLSYSIYLVHLPVLHQVLIPFRMAAGGSPGWTLQTLGGVGIAAALVLGISLVTYNAIERPFLARKANVGS
jgi:peptidoglycan/LPS O-acetylase OafA/YrhL